MRFPPVARLCSALCSASPDDRKRFITRYLVGGSLALGLLLFGDACSPAPEIADNVPNDEAKAAGLTAQDFRYPITEKENFFRGMDGVAAPLPKPDQLLDPAGFKPGQPANPRPRTHIVHRKKENPGRNNWIVWGEGKKQ